MDTSKIIIGTVGGGRYTVTAPIVKEDYGLYLKIEGLELPTTYEVDFSNSEHNGTAVTMIGNADGVLIPHQFIDTGKDVFAFLYHVGVDFGRTVYKFRIPNKLRPDRTNEEPTPEEQSTIDQCISALNTAVAQTAQDVISADASAQSASESATSAQTSASQASASLTALTEYGNQAIQELIRIADDVNTSATNASDSAEASAQSASQAQVSAQTASQKADAITGLTATAETLPSGSSATASYDAETGVMTLGIPKGKDGTNGTDGTSPSASVSKTGKVATITITDKNGTTSAQVEDGTDGTDGVSPTVIITPITGGHRITITDADGEHSADVMDGTGSVDDVQINGTSIVEDGVANVPVATRPTSGTNAGNQGLVTLKRNRGIAQDNNDKSLYLAYPNNIDVKNGTGTFIPVTVAVQHASAFYGLAKSAGDTTQSQSSNAVGQYTEDAKIAIQKMLGIYEPPYELLNDFTLDEESGFDLTADANGTPYDLLNVMIFVYFPANLASITTGYGRYRCFDNNGKYTNAETGRYSANTAGMYKYTTVERIANLAIASFTDRQPTGGVGAWRTKSFFADGLSSGMVVDLGNIVRIACIDPEPAGTRIKIYGQRAY